MQYRVYGYTLKGWELINNQMTREEDVRELITLAKDNTNYIRLMVIRNKDNIEECILLVDCNHSYRDVQPEKKTKRLLQNYKPRL